MTTTTSDHTVRHFREVLFWPVQMMPLVGVGNAQPHWELLAQSSEAPITLTVEHIELWFFDDINVAFLKVELSATDLSFAWVCDLLYRFGRAYPTGWDEDGHGKHNVHSCRVAVCRWRGASRVRFG